MNIHSPVDGIVIDRSVVEGNTYQVTDTLLTIAQDDTLWVTASVDPRDRDRLEVGQVVTVDSHFTSRAIGGRVETIGPEKSTVRISIPNPDHLLKAGMLVRLAVAVGSAAPSTTTVTAEPPQRKTNLSLDERMNELERKLERLLDDKAGRSSNEEIIRRLSELERKVDRALHLRTGQ